MTANEEAAQAILDEHVALKESIWQHNLRTALAESQQRERRARIAAWIALGLFVVALVT